MLRATTSTAIVLFVAARSRSASFLTDSVFDTAMVVSELNLTHVQGTLPHQFPTPRIVTTAAPYVLDEYEVLSVLEDRCVRDERARCCATLPSGGLF